MDAAEQLGLEEIGPQLWAAICVQYPDLYVCLVDVEAVELGSPEIKSARVVGYGPTRRAAFDPIRNTGAKYPRHSVRFTGICMEPLIRPSLVIDDETLEILRS